MENPFVPQKPDLPDPVDAPPGDGNEEAYGNLDETEKDADFDADSDEGPAPQDSTQE